eukprot:26215-Prymnesium_polylepis.1
MPDTHAGKGVGVGRACACACACVCVLTGYGVCVCVCGVEWPERPERQGRRAAGGARRAAGRLT